MGGETPMDIPPELIGRAVQDPAFRRWLLTDPEAAVASTGYQLDDDQIAALEDLDQEAIEAAVEAMIGDLDPAKFG